VSTRDVDPIIAALRERREAAGLTRQELAGRAKIGYRTLADYEVGKFEPTLNTLCRWADALGCDVALVPRPVWTPPRFQ
jgi:transcriptional regulator with XRE-family HTH domain